MFAGHGVCHAAALGGCIGAQRVPRATRCVPACPVNVARRLAWRRIVAGHRRPRAQPRAPQPARVCGGPGRQGLQHGTPHGFKDHPDRHVRWAHARLALDVGRSFACGCARRRPVSVYVWDGAGFSFYQLPLWAWQQLEHCADATVTEVRGGARAGVLAGCLAVQGRGVGGGGSAGFT